MWKTRTYVEAGKNMAVLSAMDYPDMIAFWNLGMGDAWERNEEINEQLDVSKWSRYDWYYKSTTLVVNIAAAKGVNKAIELGNIGKLTRFDNFFSKFQKWNYGTGKSFGEIAEGATNITIRSGRSTKNLLVEGSAQENWGKLMSKHGKTVDDLIFSEDGSTAYFTTNSGKTTYSLYFQTSKGAAYVETTISETIVEGEATNTIKLRFTED